MSDTGELRDVNPDAPASQNDWFWEGNVQHRLARHLARAGWQVLGTSDTASKETGPDLLLRNGSRTLVVEVKGYPSSVYERGPRRGQPKPTTPSNRARQWYSHALLAALTYHGTTEAEVAMAFPDFETYRRLLAKTRRALGDLGIGVYLVGAAGDVKVELAHCQGQ